MKLRHIFWPAAVALVLAIVLFGVVAAQSDNGNPLPGTVMNVQAVTIFSSDVITTDQQSTALDISRYQGADLFVTVDVGADGNAPVQRGWLELCQLLLEGDEE